jgi:hypothetical protein
VRSVRELEAYIDQHCRFEPASAVNVELFPQTAATIEEAEKVISITYNHHVHPDAKDGNSQRIYSTVSWKRADGAKKSKTCDHSVTGVIVVGPNRGEAFKVCVNKDKCNTHWGAERRAKEKAAKKPAPANDDWKARQQAQEERWKREREAREREEKAWKAALPEILKAVAAKVRSQLPIAKVISELLDSQRSQDVKEAASLLGIAPTTGPEEALRTLLLVALLDESQFYQKTAFSKTVKTMLGVDVAAILKAHTSAAEAKPPAKPAKKKRAKKR